MCAKQDSPFCFIKKCLKIFCFPLLVLTKKTFCHGYNSSYRKGGEDEEYDDRK